MTQQWVNDIVIEFNFCPFAKREYENQRIHYQVVEERAPEQQLQALLDEFKRLDKNTDIETTLLILPKGLESFFDYLDLVDVANSLLESEGYEGIYQIASFHPDYCFAEAKQNDASNYTNRSPYPILHILREASLEKVLAKYPDPETIPENNVNLAQQKGEEFFKQRLAEILNTSIH